MRYRLSWLETWSEKHEPPQGVAVEYSPNEDWWDHQYTFQFTADSNDEAKELAVKWMVDNSSAFDFEIWSLYCEDPIMTEEDV